jgi:SulP family sulfate permease
VSEPPSPGELDEQPAAEGPSMLTTMFRRSPPDTSYFYTQKEGPALEEDGVPGEEGDDEGRTAPTRVSVTEPRPLLARRVTAEDASEASPLLAAGSREAHGGGYGIGGESGSDADLESQKQLARGQWLARTADTLRLARGRVASILPVIGNPKRWDRRALWDNVVVAPVACLPAVVVCLLQNILDALSYGEHHEALIACR